MADFLSPEDLSSAGSHTRSNSSSDTSLSSHTESRFGSPVLPNESYVSCNPSGQQQGNFLDGTISATQGTRTPVDESWLLVQADTLFGTDQTYPKVSQPLLEQWDGYWPQSYTQEQLNSLTSPVFANISADEHLSPNDSAFDNHNRYHCSHSGCDSSFSKHCDLRRHETTIHPDPSQRFWVCGCCLNLGTKFRNNRKDLLKQHLQKSHSLPRYQDPSECSLCSSETGILLFPFGSCLKNHEELEHSSRNGFSIFVDPAQNGFRREEPCGWYSQAEHDCRSSNKALQRAIHPIPKRQKRDATGTGINDQRAPESCFAASRNVPSPDAPSVMAAQLPNDSVQQFWLPYPSQAKPLRASCDINISDEVVPQRPGTPFFGAQFCSLSFPEDSLSANTGLLVPLAENSHESTSQIHISPATGTLGKLPTTEIVVTKMIHEFSPTQFLMLCNELIEYERLLDLVDTNTTFSRTTPITYSPTQRTLRIHGLEAKVRSVCQIFKNPRNLATAYAMQKIQHVDRLDIDEVLREISSSARCSHNEPKDEESNLRIFAVNAQDDVALIDAWERLVVPHLPQILHHTLGCEYSVCLVREGLSKQESRPCARIQSPKKPSLRNQQYIIKDILHRLAQRPVTPPSIRFLKGETTDLVDDADNSEDYEDVETFPYHKSYWEKPGMGASVGLYSDLQISGTLGGYITADSKQYLLVANHMIDGARKRGFQEYGDRIRLTSPSLADVDELNKSLKHSLLSSDARIREILSSEEDYISPSEARSLLNAQKFPNLDYETAVLLFLQAQVTKNPEDYIVGNLAANTSNRRRQYSGSPFARPALFRDDNWIRMDWAIFEVRNEHRIGQNRHRYRQFSDGGHLDYSSTRDASGVGTHCQQVCHLEPNTPVLYVGRNSGLRRGEINASRMTISMGSHEQPSNEFFMVPEGPQFNLEECRGDSGAWILKDTTNEAMGTIHAMVGSCPLVTPLKDTMEDIKSVTRATQLGLSPSPGVPPPQAQLAADLCDVGNRFKPAKRYNIASLLNPSAVNLMLKRGTGHEIDIPRIKNLSSTPSLGHSSSRSIEQELSTPTAEVDQRVHFTTPTEEFDQKHQFPSHGAGSISLPPIRTFEEDQAMGRLRAIPST